jgi:prolyl oligopeptidase
MRSSVRENSKKKYPISQKIDCIDNYFGRDINDPYRWLENESSLETLSWITKQNQFSRDFLDQIKERKWIKEQLTGLWDFARQSIPTKQGGKYFYLSNSGLQHQSVVYVLEALDSEPKKVFDPTEIESEIQYSIHSFTISKNGKYAAIGLSINGSDWISIKVMDLSSLDFIADEINGVKFGEAVWHGEGFYYTAYPGHSGKSNHSRNDHQKLYYHQIGDKQEDDLLIYEDNLNPLNYIVCQKSTDNKYLLVSSVDGTHGQMVYYMDLEKGIDSPLRPLNNDHEYRFSFIDHKNGAFYFITNRQAPNNKLVKIEPVSNDKLTVTDIVAESDCIWIDAKLIKNGFVAKGNVDGFNVLKLYDFDGNRKKIIHAPDFGYIGDYYADITDDFIIYEVTSFKSPNYQLVYDLETSESQIFFKPELSGQLPELKMDRVHFKSKDGQEVPMFLMYKEGMVRNKENPVLLYGYGGFNVILSPFFNPAALLFVKQGGIFAVANVRGGGEFGEKWHSAAILDKKQNSFDDFIGAAKYLIRENYTTPEKLAIQGKSNGGLLVGAVMTQRPDLFKVAIPVVGLLDMLRYHKFTVAHGWKKEYGSSDNYNEFKTLLAYSPLHNIRPGTKYPATLVVSGMHDNRVVPAHSFKFIATLQEHITGENPVMIRIDTKAGHGTGKSVQVLIEEQTDIQVFLFHFLGLTVTKPDSKDKS